MGHRIREHDWSRTPLGPLENWPSPLAHAVEIMLASRQPGYIAWGPALTSLYNDACIPILGTKHPQGLGLPYEELWPEILEEFRPVLEATLAGEAQYFIDRPVALAGRDVSLSFFTFSWTPLRDQRGAVAGFLGTASETTPQIRAAQGTALRYSSLINSIDVGFCIVELKFDSSGRAQDYRFIEVNPAFEQQTGLTQAAGRWMRELAPEHEQHWFDIYGQVARTGEPVRFTQQARALQRAFSVYAFRIGEPAENLVAVLFSDITEKQRAEEALLNADRRKDEFLATLSHELRNPLAPLRNGLQIARLTATEDPTLRRTLDMMDRQLTHLVRLVDDLLDIRRISSGKLELRLQRLDLRKALANSVEASRAAIENRRHELTVDIDPGDFIVNGDFDRLTQIFTNLLSNAAKYTDRGGHIRLRVDHQEGFAAVRVSDSGVGIPPEELPRVFDLFSQVAAHQSHSAGGLGIGLSLAKTLTELHGGTVEARSEGLGRGSEFTVRLPLTGYATH
jgi:PAS domain S-box-containing protein